MKLKVEDGTKNIYNVLFFRNVDFYRKSPLNVIYTEVRFVYNKKEQNILIS